MNLPEGITLQWEHLPAVSREILPLFLEHWQETSSYKGLFQLDPAWDRLFAYDLSGLLRVFTARCDSLLVGYAFLFVAPSLNSDAVAFAHVERIYLQPAHRRGWLGVHMVKGAEAMARELKAAVIHTSDKCSEDRGLGVILRRLGYKPDETVYSKVL